MTAMDEKAVERRVEGAIQRERENQRAVRAAVRAVQPWTGAMAFDEAVTADDVFRGALDYVGVDTKGVHPSAYRLLLESQPRPGAERPAARRERQPAMDAAAGASFGEMFPETAGIGSV